MTKLNMFAALICLATSLAAFGANSVEYTPAQRENMAKLHENMATCLRSKDKTVAQCHQAMRQECQEFTAKGGCPMMGMGWGAQQGQGMGPSSSGQTK